MRIYLIHDTDPDGGYFCAQEFKPDVSRERPSVDEVRLTDIPEELWREMLDGLLPVDEDHSNDSTWVEYWEDADHVWSR